MVRFGDLARRRASSRSSATWTNAPPLRSLAEEFRRRNFLHQGDTRHGQVIRENVDLDDYSHARSSFRIITNAAPIRPYEPALAHEARHRFATSCMRGFTDPAK